MFSNMPGVLVNWASSFWSWASITCRSESTITVLNTALPFLSCRVARLLASQCRRVDPVIENSAYRQIHGGTFLRRESGNFLRAILHAQYQHPAMPGIRERRDFLRQTLGMRCHQPLVSHRHGLQFEQRILAEADLVPQFFRGVKHGSTQIRCISLRKRDGCLR